MDDKWQIQAFKRDLFPFVTFDIGTQTVQVAKCLCQFSFERQAKHLNVCLKFDGCQLPLNG